MIIKIAENLYLLRKEKGMTQEELAEIFNVTSQSISKWELGLSCPDITLLPRIAEFFKISIDELLGYKPLSSINSIYLEMKSLLEKSNNKIDDVYRLSRLAASLLNVHEYEDAKNLLDGRRANNLSYGQGDGGVKICGDNTLFVCSFNNFKKYDITTIRKISKYLNRISDFNTLKVLFGLFELMIEDTIIHSYSIDEIKDKVNLDVDSINKAFNNLDIYFDEEEYEKTGIEKYSLEHVDQVPLLVTLLIPALHNYNNTIRD